MSRALFEPEHEAFRETVATFLDKEAAPLDRLPKIVAWSQRMETLGNGKRSDIEANDALDIAKSAQPAAIQVDADDPSGL